MENVITLIKETIKENFDPDKIILFGSYAYGNPSKESDIDLLIIKDIPNDQIRQNRYQIRYLLHDIIKP